MIGRQAVGTIVGLTALGIVFFFLSDLVGALLLCDRRCILGTPSSAPATNLACLAACIRKIVPVRALYVHRKASVPPCQLLSVRMPSR